VRVAHQQGRDDAEETRDHEEHRHEKGEGEGARRRMQHEDEARHHAQHAVDHVEDEAAPLRLAEGIADLDGSRDEEQPAEEDHRGHGGEDGGAQGQRAHQDEDDAEAEEPAPGFPDPFHA